MLIMSSLLIVFIISVTSGYAKRLPLPSYIVPCSKSAPNFDDCCLEHGRDALPTLLKGDKKYHVPVLTPLVLPSLSLDAGKDLQIKLSDVHLYGLDEVDLRKIKFNLEEQTIRLNMYLDILNIISQYKLNGRLLVLPLTGEGDVNVTSAGLDVNYSMKYKLAEKGEDDYLEPETHSVDYTLQKVYVKLDNLFNGHKELGEQTNKVLNEQWVEFAEELKPVISETILAVAKSIITGFFSRIPFENIFLP